MLVYPKLNKQGNFWVFCPRHKEEKKLGSIDGKIKKKRKKKKKIEKKSKI